MERGRRREGDTFTPVAKVSQKILKSGLKRKKKTFNFPRGIRCKGRGGEVQDLIFDTKNSFFQKSREVLWTAEEVRKKTPSPESRGGETPSQLIAGAARATLLSGL